VDGGSGREVRALEGFCRGENSVTFGAVSFATRMCAMISQELTNLMAEILECDAATLSGDTSFHEHQNWDSIAHISTVVAIEERFGLAPPLSQLKTISDLAAYIRGKF
jgi:acyl carrier protein